jgi:hypothetical protein
MLRDAIPTGEPQESAKLFGVELQPLADAWQPDGS